MDPKKVREQLLEKFRQVCTERVNTILEHFSAVQASPDNAELIDRLMREVHTLKGELRIMGFTDGGRVVHALEDELRRLRDQAFSAAGGFRDTLTDGLDEVSGMVLQDRSPDADAICGRIGDWHKPGNKPAPLHKLPARPPATPSAASEPAYVLSDVVRVSGTKLDRLGDMAGDLFTSYLRLQELARSLDDLVVDARALDTSIKQMEEIESQPLPSELHPAWQSQRLNRNLTQFRRALQDRATGMATVLDQVIDQVRELRLLPVTTLFDLYKKAARDMAREKNKRVEVLIDGGTTMVDRSVLDALADIMLHLIRNAVDHGIEVAEERTRARKSEHGTLVLRAALAGDRILIDVEDDGRGIQTDEIKRSAVKKGALTQAEVDGLSEDGALELIFRPGFTTAERATETSGRGVGMDVVRSRVQEFGGAVNLTSVVGQGTRFTVELPTSIAITRVFLFRTAGQIFALMATFIDRVDRLDPADLIDTSAGQAIVLSDQTVPVADAATLLRLGASQRDNGQLPMLVMAHGGKQLALIVDALVGERELTIKPLGRYLSGTSGVSGAAMLEDGTVVLVLHAGDLVTGTPGTRARVQPAPTVQEERAPRVLLVEDSLITRELERSMLVSLGLTVVEAIDGVEAIDKLEKEPFDLIVADVEMPRLDGFELTRRVKQDDRWARIPVILVTTRGTPEDKKRGLIAGADAYVVKSEFKSKSFIETVRRFLP